MKPAPRAPQRDLAPGQAPYRPPRRHGHVRVHGQVGGRITLGSLLGGMGRRAGRRAVDRATLGPQRREARYRARVLRDRARLGPARRTVARWENRTPPVQDGGAPQVTPACGKYIGQRPWDYAKTRMGLDNKSVGLCPSCRLPLDLEHGRIPDHQPGPPPFVRCPGCGAYLCAYFPQLRKRGGSYSDIMCPLCVDKTDADSGPDGTTDYGD